MNRFHRFCVVALLFLAADLFAMSVRPPSFEELVAGAETVIRSEVLDTRCEYRGEGANRRIVTIVHVRVEHVIVGEAPAEMELEMLGGQVGTEGLEVAGMTCFHKGDRDILFIAGNGKFFCPLVGINHGRYLLVPRDGEAGEFVARTDNTPLSAVSEVEVPVEAVKARAVSTTAEALSVTEFEARIVSCAKGLRAKQASNSSVK